MQGTFRQKADQHTEGAVSRENKNKETVWELHHETINGHIENAYLRKNEKYGNELNIAILNKEANMRVMVNVPISSSYTRKFLMVAGNIDYRAPVEIIPHYFADKKKPGKFVTGWCFYQHDSKDQIAEYINKEDVPEVIKHETVSGVKYDDTDALNYLWNKWLKVAEKNNFKEPDRNTAKDEEDPEERSSRDSPRNSDRNHYDDEEEERPQARKASGPPTF